MLEVASSSSAFQVAQNQNHNNNNNNNNVNNINNNVEVKPVRPKRDFRFKVIEVQNGPKWFVWPSRRRGSSEDVDENHNKGKKKVTDEKAKCTAAPPAVVEPNNASYTALRRSVVRQSKRKQDQDAIAMRTASEPASARRLSAKKEKAVTEPIGQVSSMFKIISIEKNWESFDATDDDDDEDDEEGSTRTVSVISLASLEGGERRWTTSI